MDVPGRLKNRFLTVAAFFGAAWWGLAPASADQVIVGNADFGRVRITGFEGGRLFFQVGDGTEQGAWIDEATRIIVDTASGFEDFNDAETALANADYDRAIGRYERALRRSRNYWQDVISCRLVAAYLADGRLDRAAGYFIAVARSARAGPRAAARLLPSVVSSAKHRSAARAVEQLDSALRGASDAPDTTVLRLLRFAIAQPAGRGGGAREAHAVLRAPLDESLRIRAAYQIRVQAAEALLAAGALEGPDFAGIDEGILHAPADVVAGFLLTKGRARMIVAKKPDQVIRATWLFMRIAIHMPADPLAPQALLEAGRGLERVGREAKAVALWRECLGMQQIDEQTRKVVEAEVARVEADAAMNR